MNNRIEIIKGDITKIKVDAIVNAANSSLMGGGGVDGAIHRAGGPAILEECKTIVARQGGCKTGEAVITTGGNLPATYVIHTVGPVWNGGNNNEKEKLSNCYLNSLQLAVDHNCKTIAFPNISTGIYRFPKEEAAKISIDSIQNFLSRNTFIEKVIIVCFDDENFRHVLNRVRNVQESDTTDA
jgi:O-acetyl-ADP-ribose deacetylase